MGKYKRFIKNLEKLTLEERLILIKSLKEGFYREILLYSKKED